MSTVKLHPPNPLPPKKLTHQQFDRWHTELHEWLGGDEILSHFLPDGNYPTWESEEANQHRIAVLVDANSDWPIPRQPYPNPEGTS